MPPPQQHYFLFLPASDKLPLSFKCECGGITITWKQVGKVNAKAILYVTQDKFPVVPQVTEIALKKMKMEAGHVLAQSVVR